jgi:energy-coupling factor transporter ATP-binding protein EcfA2
MSFNFEKIGKPLCIIQEKKPGAAGPMKDKMIYLATGDEKEEPKHPFTFWKFENGVNLQQVPNTSSEREILYITGASGSGKSTYTRLYCEQYKKKFPKNSIILFSSLPEDESLDSVQPKRFTIDDRLIDEPITTDNLGVFQDTCVIFDDIDVLTNKKHRQAVMDIANGVLEIGRHFNITAIFTNHLPTNKGDTRRVLNESHSVVYFPHSGSMRGTRYLLEQYVGLDKDMISKIKRMPTRWCCVFKNYPQAVMTQRRIMLASMMDEEDGKAVDSDGSTEGEEDFEDVPKGRKKK